MPKLQDARCRLADFRKQRQLLDAVSNISDSPSGVDVAKDEDNLELVDQTVCSGVVHEQRPSGKHEEERCQEAKSSWLVTGLKICVWLLMWGFFVEVGFGMVYVLLCGLLFMVLSLRGGKKRAAGVPSAYSVFNKNFEVIDGTFTADQFERELRYGPSAVR